MTTLLTERELTMRIVAVAMKLDSGLIVTMPPPARHHTVLHAAPTRMHYAEQGFLTSDGSFATRMQALEIARLSGQILRETAPQQGLFSEDVW